MMNYINQKLAQTIKTLRESCDTMERTLNSDSMTDVAKINQILHEMAWGTANAMTGITSALNQVDRTQQMKDDHIEDLQNS